MSSLPLDIRTTFGAVFVGLVASAVFYGVTVLQTLVYFQTFPEDKFLTRCLVAFIWALDTASLAMITDGVWQWLVVGFANPFSLLNVPLSMKVEPIFTATLALVVHLFMAHRIKILDPRKRFTVLAGVIAVLSLFPWVMGIVVVNFWFSTPEGFGGSRSLLWVTTSANSTTAALDITILVVLCAHLNTMKTEVSMKRTSRVIHMLTIYVVANNLLTSFITLSGLISYLAAPDNLAYLALHTLVSKAYANTFMAQLNARDTIRRRVRETTAQVSTLRVHTDTQVLHIRDPKDAFSIGQYSTKQALSSTEGPGAV